MSNKILGIFIAVILPLLFFFYFDYPGPPKRPRLKRYFPLAANALQSNKVLTKDTLWHTVPPFAFIGQHGHKVTEKHLNDKICVANFFDTRCADCRKVSKELQRIQYEFRDDEELMLLSHTLLPEQDSVVILKNYAEQFEADSSRWLFVTGEKAILHQQASEGCKITRNKQEDSLHTHQLVLLDKNRIIRAFHNGTKPESVNQMMIDIKILKLEYPKLDPKIEYQHPSKKKSN